MRSKHTPGPWKVFICDDGGEWSGWPLSITAPSVHQDCMVVRTGGQWPYQWDYRISQAEAEANARLIAAAPEVVEAAQGLIAAIDAKRAFERDNPNDLTKLWERVCLTDVSDAEDALRAAITKATGEAL